MRLPLDLHLPVRDPYAAGVGRLRRTLRVDRTVLRHLRHAAQHDDEGWARLTLAWALGLADVDEVDTGDLVAAEVYVEAARLLPDDPGAQYGAGLANVGTFGRRRSVPLAARRGFTNAARLDRVNAVPHVALAALRFSAGDSDSALQALHDALAADAYRPYPSPVAGEITAAAPWLGQSLAYVWPARSELAARYAMHVLAARAEQRDRSAEWLVLLRRLAVLLLAAEPTVDNYLLGATAVAREFRARQVAGEEAAEHTRQAVALITADLLESRRSLVRQFESAVREMVGAAYGGVAGGLSAAALGAWRSRRSLLLITPPQVLLGCGLAAASASALALLLPNPAFDARRRMVERRLLQQETELVLAARGRVEGVLGTGAGNASSP